MAISNLTVTYQKNIKPNILQINIGHKIKNKLQEKCINLPIKEFFYLI